MDSRLVGAVVWSFGNPEIQNVLHKKVYIEEIAKLLAKHKHFSTMF